MEAFAANKLGENTQYSSIIPVKVTPTEGPRCRGQLGDKPRIRNLFLNASQNVKRFRKPQASADPKIVAE